MNGWIGSAYVFESLQNIWTQTAKLRTHDIAAGDYMGGTVGLYEDTALVSTLDDDSGIDSGRITFSSSSFFLFNGE